MFPALKRVFEVSGCRTQLELATMFDIRQSSISDAKRRGSVPSEWLVKLQRLKGVNPDWILTGKGPKYLSPSESGPIEPHVAYRVEIRPPAECSAKELVNELVRRALKSPDLEEFRKQVKDSWRAIIKDE